MSLEERDRILALLAGRPRPADSADRRAGFELFARSLWPGAEIPPAFEPLPGLTARWAPEAPAGPTGVLLWLHGGAFQVGSSESYWPMAAEMARAAGLHVLVPDYALAPEHRFPVALEQVGQLLDWLAGRGHRTAIGGDSAGGNLAVAATHRALQSGRPVPAACWLVSPYLDLTHGGGSIVARRHRDRFVNPDDGTNRLYAGSAALDDPAVSPLFGSFPGFPETFVQVGSEEVLRDDAVRLSQRLWDEGRTAQLQEWAGMFHVWPLFAPRLAEGRWAILQGGAFLRRIFQA